LPLKKTEGRRPIDTSLALMRQVIQRYNFLDKNSRVLVALSGGVDSLVLLVLLIEYNKRFTQNWEIHACHIDPCFPGWNTGYVKKFFIEHNISHTVVKTDIGKKIKSGSNRCFLCARARRKKLLEIAEKLSIFHIALAHHKQDAAETILLNMMYNGEISTLVPKQSILKGRFFFIRPLYYIDKEAIEKISYYYGLPGKSNVCPYYKESKREEVRKILNKIKKENPDVYRNIFRSMFHINKAYMPFSVM
jgi:tRNA 2-thiocytidine biosynthesis protein TtcA